MSCHTIFHPFVKTIKTLALTGCMFMVHQGAWAQDFEYVWEIGSGVPDLCITKAVTTDSLGNAFILTEYIGTVDVDNGPGVFNVHSHPIYGNGSCLVKLDPAGDFVWAKEISNVRFSALTIDKEGNILVTGIYGGLDTDVDPSPSAIFYLDQPTCTAGTRWGHFVLKLDHNGDFIWARSFLGICSTGVKHQVRDLVTDSASNIYVSGYFYDTLNFDPPPGAGFSLNTAGMVQSNAFIHKLDKDGNFVWAKQLRGVGQELPYSIKINPQGHLVIAGAITGEVDFDPGPGVHIGGAASSADGDMFVLKLTQNGDFVAVTVFINPGEQSITNMDLGTDGSIYITGIIRDVVDFDPGPGTYSTPATFTSLYDGFAAKYDPSMALQWAKRFGPIVNSNNPQISVDRWNNVYTSGTYHLLTTIDLDPGPGIDTFDIYNSLSLAGEFIQKLDPAGNFVWARSISAHLFYTLHADDFGAVYIGGMYEGTHDFDPGPAAHNMTADHDGYVLKLSGDITTALPDLTSAENLFHLYPNPATNQVIVSTENTTAQKIILTDVYGRLVKTVLPASSKTMVDITGLATGIYCITVIAGDISSTVKIIKQ